MHKAIETYLAELMPLIQTRGLLLENTIDLPYGIQLVLKRDAKILKLNIYYSEKRGISTVINPNKDKALVELMQHILQITPKDHSIPERLHQWTAWIGSDECGKGDYFGALVVTAFYADTECEKALKKLGVCDSKKLNDNQISTIAQSIYREFPGRFETIILKPQAYNKLYADMNRQGKNLNDLLAWLHSKAIETLYARHKGIEGALIDQFSKSRKVEKSLKTKLPLLNVIERTGAEQDIAVAAASILSRYHFLQHHKEMIEHYGIAFPKGATSVIKTGRDFIKTYSYKRLYEVAKLHFKTTAQLTQQDLFAD
jgi:ribonuclease HIII